MFLWFLVPSSPDISSPMVQRRHCAPINEPATVCRSNRCARARLPLQGRHHLSQPDCSRDQGLWQHSVQHGAGLVPCFRCRQERADGAVCQRQSARPCAVSQHQRFHWLLAVGEHQECLFVWCVCVCVCVITLCLFSCLRFTSACPVCFDGWRAPLGHPQALAPCCCMRQEE